MVQPHPIVLFLDANTSAAAAATTTHPIELFLHLLPSLLHRLPRETEQYVENANLTPAQCQACNLSWRQMRTQRHEEATYEGTTLGMRRQDLGRIEMLRLCGLVGFVI